MIKELKELYPDCFINFKYPYVFKFNLILDDVDFGEIEIKVEKGLDISEIKGEKKALTKLDDLTKEKKGETFGGSGLPYVSIEYPLTKIDQLDYLLIYKIRPNKDFRKFKELIRNNYNPFNVEKLSKKAGIEILY